MARDLSTIKIKDPRDILVDMLKATSGANVGKNIKYNIFYRLIAFKGLSHGVGCSTIVANTAIALAKFGLTVAVIDTSMLNPVQDVLLNTKKKEDDDDSKKVDWFDLPFTESSVLHQSKKVKTISVLSFSRRDRTILDMLGTADNAELVDMALEVLQSKFDIILLDLCDEVTEVNAACLQKAQRVIQICSNSLSCVSNMDRVITNNVILSCPMDKMRYVVENKMINDTIGSMDGLYKQYRYKKLANCPLSIDIARIASLNATLFQYATDIPEVIKFTEMILDIVVLLLNIDDGTQPRGTITSEDIENGKVRGTLHYKDKKEMEEAPKVEVVTPNSMDDIEEVEKKKGFFGRRKG